jgi:hypothetical protein
VICIQILIFCTIFYREEVSIGAIMSASGHKTEKEFWKYIREAGVRIDVVAEQILSIPGIPSQSRLQIA